ncbi:hypothetical protein P0F65_10180 [Sphingomonas sp. I4]
MFGNAAASDQLAASSATSATIAPNGNGRVDRASLPAASSMAAVPPLFIARIMSPAVRPRPAARCVK